MQKIINLGHTGLNLIDVWLRPLVLLAARIHIGWVFFASGMVKYKDFDSAVLLFEWEYEIKIISYEFTAMMATIGELLLPVLLFLGLFTRFGVAGLLVMTAVIESVYPGTTDHRHWAAILLLLFATGPGNLSVDWLLKNKVFKKVD